MFFWGLGGRVGSTVRMGFAYTLWIPLVLHVVGMVGRRTVDTWLRIWGDEPEGRRGFEMKRNILATQTGTKLGNTVVVKIVEYFIFVYVKKPSLKSLSPLSCIELYILKTDIMNHRSKAVQKHASFKNALFTRTDFFYALITTRDAS